MFDETVIGGSVSIPIVIGERKDSVRLVSLPLPIASHFLGSTPFRVFILRTPQDKNNIERRGSNSYISTRVGEGTSG